MDTYNYILQKFNLRHRREYFLEIPNMNRDNLASLFAELGFTKGAEIGVDKGIYSEVLCKTNPKLHLYSIDPWRTSAYKKDLSGIDAPQSFFDSRYKEAKKRLSPYNCTIIRKTSLNALADFADNSLDFVYIDGNHDFVHVAQDIHYWLAKIRAGGILSGHDYAYFPARKYNHVKRVVDSYMQSYGMFPYFIVGSYNSPPGLIRDRYRSWFWVKK